MRGLFVLLYLTALVSWVVNIVKFVGMLGGEVTAMFIARIVGMPFFPLGVVLGWF